MHSRGREVSLPLVIFEVLHISGLFQDCSDSIANALELLLSCTKQSIYSSIFNMPKCQIEYV